MRAVLTADGQVVERSERNAPTRLENDVHVTGTAIRETRVKEHVGLEVFVCLIHDIPFAQARVDVSVSQEEFPYFAAYWGTATYAPIMLPQPWSLFMFFRLYLVVRVMRDREFGPAASILRHAH
jgi:hypothetical protein